MNKKYLNFKRFLDIIFSLFLIVVLSPIFAIVSILIKLDSKGEVIFKQARSGKNNKTFNVYKFRTMVSGNDVMNFKESDKVTKIGKILRKTSLDELPQLFNILKGEMSFIGPRPWILEYSKYFNEEQMRRLDVLPGITGLAQCEGRNGLSIIEKLNYDIEYVDNISLKMDLYVIYRSIITVLLQEDASSSKETIKSEIDELKENYINKNYNTKNINNKKRKIIKNKKEVSIYEKSFI